MFTCMSMDCKRTSSSINNKGHSTSESLHVIFPISVCDFVLTVIVTIVETADL